MSRERTFCSSEAHSLRLVELKREMVGGGRGRGEVVGEGVMGRRVRERKGGSEGVRGGGGMRKTTPMRGSVSSFH